MNNETNFFLPADEFEPIPLDFDDQQETTSRNQHGLAAAAELSGIEPTPILEGKPSHQTIMNDHQQETAAQMILNSFQPEQQQQQQQQVTSVRVPKPPTPPVLSKEELVQLVHQVSLM